MKERDKRLTQLLKQVETDKPHSDFTTDIMQMITESTALKDSLSSIDSDLIIEKAPMHMTDLVMQDVASSIHKSYSLINPTELKRAAIIMLIGFSISLILWLNSTAEFDFQLDNYIDKILFDTIAIIVSGTILWSIDRWLRNKYLNFK